jgi:hypothetical protein
MQPRVTGSDCTADNRAAMEAWIDSLLKLLALPEYGLSTIFLIAFISATLLPLGSEPAVFGPVMLNPDPVWPAILVATVGGTLGGSFVGWMGLGAERADEHVAHPPLGRPRMALAASPRRQGLSAVLVADRWALRSVPRRPGCRSGPAWPIWRSAVRPPFRNGRRPYVDVRPVLALMKGGRGCTLHTMS